MQRTYTGVIRAARTSDLGFERTAKLIDIQRDEGDRVEKGQLLARLDTRNLEARRQELTAKRDAAQALLDELVAGPRQQTIDSARAEVRDLEAQLQLVRSNLERNKSLVEEAAISIAALDDSSFGAASAEARLEAARQKLDELEAGTRQEKLQAQRAVVAQLEASLADVEVEIEDSTLLAPFDGTIAQRYLDEGTIVAPTMPVMRLVESGHLEAWIGLPPATTITLNVGDTHEVLVGGAAYGARVSALLPELDPATRTRSVILDLNADAAEDLVPSQVARLVLREHRRMQGYWLPTTALTRGTRGLWSVLAVEEDAVSGSVRAARRDVEILHTEGDRAYVRGTLQPRESIICNGTHRLVPGQLVQLHDTSDQ
jgi:RND family efflux transporter MFP subunit